MPTLSARNPRTGALDYSYEALTPAGVAALAARLRAGQPAWEAMGLDGRIAVLQRWKQALMDRRQALIDAVSADTGRYLIATGEAMFLPGLIDRWCGAAPGLVHPKADTPAKSVPTVRYRHQLIPYPLVGVISPWNFPVVLSFIDAIPALLAGSAVLIKPSEVTPRFADPIQAAIEDVPELAAVLAFARGAGDVGAAVVPNVDCVCFTGSVKTGRLVGEAAAKAFIPAFLELGGKDPVIVTASADPVQAAATVLRGCVQATGQACQSIERVYVDAKIAQAFLAALTEQANACQLNTPDLHSGQVGPIIFDQQADILAAQLADATAKGAKILSGGAIETHQGGKWLRPTVLAGVTHEMAVMTEETFGPIIPVMTFASTEEALTLANDSIYGLSGAVLSGDEAEAIALAERMNVGAVSINDCALTAVMYEAEKNSFKLSGLGGSRMGESGFLRFLRKKALLIQGGTPTTVANLEEANARPNR
jgi:succinate-semialdehyde dehydrogenase / glutarate-semialdehyde dehydrogenase